MVRGFASASTYLPQSIGPRLFSLFLEAGQFQYTMKAEADVRMPVPPVVPFPAFESSFWLQSFQKKRARATWIASCSLRNDG